MLKSNSTANNNNRRIKNKNYNTPHLEDSMYRELNLFYEIQQGARRKFTDEFLEASSIEIDKLENSSNISNANAKTNNIVCIFSFKEKKYGRIYSYDDYEFSAIENMLYSSGLNSNSDSLYTNKYEINIQSVFNSIEEMFCAVIFQKKIEIDYAFDSEIYSLGLSPLHLKVILYHIIGNSMELCKKLDKIICTVSTNDTSICIDIHDSGLRHNSKLIDDFRELREDSNTFFNDEFIKSLVRLYGGTITRNYSDIKKMRGNITSIVIPKK